MLTDSEISLASACGEPPVLLPGTHLHVLIAAPWPPVGRSECVGLAPIWVLGFLHLFACLSKFCTLGRALITCKIIILKANVTLGSASHSFLLSAQCVQRHRNSCVRGLHFYMQLLPCQLNLAGITEVAKSPSPLSPWPSQTGSGGKHLLTLPTEVLGSAPDAHAAPQCGQPQPAFPPGIWAIRSGRASACH